MSRSSTSFDDCLAALEPDQRAALEKLRAIIKKAAPDAEEGVSYGIAAFRWRGKPLAGLSASKSHCSYHPMSGSVVAMLADELAKYETSKGTIRFPATKPLPATLVRKLVQARREEIESASGPVRDEAVTSLLDDRDPPLRDVVELLRDLLLGVDKAVREGVKWNSPSYRTTDWFATINLHDAKSLRLILHRGAKAKASGMTVPDPTAMLQWLGEDRAMITFATTIDMVSRKKALVNLLRAWVTGG